MIRKTTVTVLAAAVMLGCLMPAMAADSERDLTFEQDGVKLSLYGEAWVYLYAPRSIDGHEYPSEMNLDYLWLRLEADMGNYGFRTWYSLRDERRFGSFAFDENFFYEAYAYADTPVGELRVGKVLLDLGCEWDHTWYGSLLYLKGFMCEGDWGAKLVDEHVLAGGETTVGYSIGAFNRSDAIDGATVLEAFDIEEFRSPEFGVNEPESSHGDRRQRNFGYARGTVKHAFSDKTELTVGATIYHGEIEYSSGVTEDETNYEVDINLKCGDLALFFEGIAYDRGDVIDEDIEFEDFNRGVTWLTEVHYTFYSSEDNEWIDSLAAWVNYSVDEPDEGRRSDLWIFALGAQCTEKLRVMVEYVDWEMDDFRTMAGMQVDRGWYIGAGYSF